jgi:IS5 family transposase
VIAKLKALTGIETRRIHVDKGYRGHNHAQSSVSGRITAPIRREMHRHATLSLSLGT